MLAEHPWPEDLPAECPDCGKALGVRHNLIIGPGKASRCLKRLSFGMLVPWSIIAVIWYFLAGAPNQALGGGYIIIGLMAIPPAIVAYIGAILPSSRRVQCNACGWVGEFSIEARAKKEE